MKDEPGIGRERQRSPEQSGGPPRLSSGMEFAGLGMQFAGSMGLFGVLGWWLDRRLGTTPWLLILLIFVGAGAAFYSMYQRVFGSTARRGASEPRAGRSGDAPRDGGRR